MSNVEELIFQAKLAEQTERYEDMAQNMHDLIKNHSKELKTEERNLLSVAYKNKVGSRRSAWRILNSIGGKESFKNATDLLDSYKKKIEKELNDCCQEVLSLIDDLLTGDNVTPEAYVFYYKMKGDYYRYLSEVNSGDHDIKCSEEAYSKAKERGDQETGGLAPTHPIRLGLALNYSVFFYEIKNDRAKACLLAKTAFDEAIAQIDNVEENNYKDSTLIMQLLRDNLTLWTSKEDIDVEGEGDRDAPEDEDN